MDIGKVIHDKRTEQGISMNELARNVGLAQSGLSAIEAGRRQPTFENLERIITIGLGYSLDEFFSCDTEKPNLSPELTQLLNTAKSLTPAQITKLNEFIKTIV